MGAIKNLIHSEKAVFVVLLVVAATVLTALGHMTVPEWKEYTTWLAGIYVAGKTIQGAADAMATSRVAAAEAAAKSPPGDGPGAVTPVAVGIIEAKP